MSSNRRAYPEQTKPLNVAGRGHIRHSSGSVTLEYLWALLAIATFLAGVIYVQRLGITAMQVPDSCAQVDEVDDLFAMRFDVWMLCLFGGLFGVFSYQLLSDLQSFFGYNWARLLVGIFCGAVMGFYLLHVDWRHINWCLSQGLKNPIDNPCRAVAPAGCFALLHLPSSFVQRFAVSSLAYTASFFQIVGTVLLSVFIGWGIRFFYFALSAGRLWVSS
jgi:hypothetical protein